MLEVSDDNDQYLVAGAVRLQSTVNAGGLWEGNANGHSDVHVAAPILGTNKFFVGSDGGVYRHRWTNLNNKVNCNDTYHTTQFLSGNYGPSGDLVIAGAIDNGTYRVKDGPRKHVLGGDGSYCHISLQDPSIAYAQRQLGGMHFTTNFRAGNPNFRKVNKPLKMKRHTNDFYNENQINYEDGRQLYVRTDSALWRTKDTGNTFQELAPNKLQIDGIGVSYDVSPTVYMARTPGNNTELWRYEGADRPLAQVVSSQIPWVPTGVAGDAIGGITVHPSDPNTIFIAFSGNVNRQRGYMVRNLDTSPSWTSMKTKGKLSPSTLEVANLIFGNLSKEELIAKMIMGEVEKLSIQSTENLNDTERPKSSNKRRPSNHRRKGEYRSKKSFGRRKSYPKKRR